MSNKMSLLVADCPVGVNAKKRMEAKPSQRHRTWLGCSDLRNERCEKFIGKKTSRWHFTCFLYLLMMTNE
jgi:hypothetical protein